MQTHKKSIVTFICERLCFWDHPREELCFSSTERNADHPCGGGIASTMSPLKTILDTVTVPNFLQNGGTRGVAEEFQFWKGVGKSKLVDSL